MIKNAKCIWCNKDMQIGYEIKNTGINGNIEGENHPYFLLKFQEVDPMEEHFNPLSTHITLFSEIICKDCMDVLTKHLKINKEIQNELKNNN